MSALRVLLLLSLAIFCGEFAIMFALRFLHIENEVVNNIVDATALVVIIFPFLYFFVLRTILNKNAELTAAQQGLLTAKLELEHRIEERTNEIAATCPTDPVPSDVRVIVESRTSALSYEPSTGSISTQNVGLPECTRNVRLPPETYTRAGYGAVTVLGAPTPSVSNQSMPST